MNRLDWEVWPQTRLGSFCLLIIVFSVISFSARAQTEIPLGAWRLHISYNNIHTVAIGSSKVFGASVNGLVMLEKTDNSLHSFSKLDGLHGGGITTISYDQPRDQVLIAYQDGVLDILKNASLTSIDLTRNSTLTGSKKINHIAIHNGLAYLAADYGVVVFDLSRDAVKETWRDIGVGGSTAKVFKSTFKGDSIFLATDKGVFAGDLAQNLLDFNFWKRFDSGDFTDSIQAVEVFNDKVFAAVKDVGIFSYEAGQWSKRDFLQDVRVESLNASPTDLWICSGNNIWRLSTDETLVPLATELAEKPSMVQVDANGQVWIADGQHGIVSNTSGNFLSYLPNGPSNAITHKIEYHDKAMYAVAGGYSETSTPLALLGNIDRFQDGVWSTQKSMMSDITDIDFSGNSDRYYLTSFGYGVEVRNTQGRIQLYDESNSPLTNINPPSRFVTTTAIASGEDGYWIANYGATLPLLFLGNDESWLSFSFSELATRYPLDLAVDFYDHVWMVLNPDMGGGVMVFDKRENTSIYLSNINGLGALPSKSVRAIAVDRDGFTWLGTDEGVCYFPDPLAVFSNNVKAIKPIFENRFLLRDDKVTAIEVDGGNRKWMGTERGVWLFNASGEEVIYNFTTSNSPLLSNVIIDIAIHAESGEVFFATDLGLVSFRADATVSGLDFQSVKIFPNPVTPLFNGTVGITGLTTDAIVKITDIAGKLVWQTQANGGTASWNVRHNNGNRAATGVYLVFATTSDGAESFVGKIAVIE